jgi:hypothetical protein
LGATHKKYRNYEDKYQKEITLETSKKFIKDIQNEI